ncbi:AmmeMemoRadiSam system protein A [Candidatus Woesearchaeota archaeon]|nr:AmmeMemoRadiSam system protein A [Candidatus Woesearchaeota archaeon]
MGAMRFTEKKFLIEVARNAIRAKLENKGLNLGDIPERLREIGASFVTLHKDGELRGCIGTLIAHSPLYEDVASNAVNAAFHDPRFPAVTMDELDSINMEISVLCSPKEIHYKDAEGLLARMKKEYGIIIKKGRNTATFLPQVWEELKDKKEFLSELCMKAGLSPTEWQKKGLRVYYYTVDVVPENI